MAAIAEFYSKNLSVEAKKGLHEKAPRGGTPGYAPLGYVNIVKRHEGIEEKTIEIDPDRGHHLTWAFRAYATGQISVTELTEELERRGLKTRPTSMSMMMDSPGSLSQRSIRSSPVSSSWPSGTKGGHQAAAEARASGCTPGGGSTPGPAVSSVWCLRRPRAALGTPLQGSKTTWVPT